MSKTVLSLAPMEDVTDTVFRQILATVSGGRPDVMYTEFTNVDGLCSKEGHIKVATRLKFTEVERPIIAQIWGNNPENFAKAAEMISNGSRLPAGRFDGININMGCPVREVVKIGGGGALVGKLELAEKIIRAVQGNTDLPVSVKTRIGNKKIETESWIGGLLSMNLDTIIVHGRLVKDMSKFPADWEEIGKAVVLRNKVQGLQTHVLDSLAQQGLAAPARFVNPFFYTKIVGNGDIKSRFQAQEMADKYGVDGVMIGRGIFTDPGIFVGRELSREERIEMLWRHAELFKKTWTGVRDGQIMKKFVKMYIAGWEGAVEERQNMYNKLDEYFSTGVVI